MFPGTKWEHFFNVLSEQNRAEDFLGAERSVLTENLDPMFPRTLVHTMLFLLSKSIYLGALKTLE